MNVHEAIVRSAARSERRLRESVLPYWLARSHDPVEGGYLLRRDVRRSRVRQVGGALLRRSGPPPSEDKQLVDQARLLWVFSHAHRNGIGAGDEYLLAACRGYEFLRERFFDPEHGGYVWLTDRAGRTLNPVKHLYGQAFVIYGCVEYARASGDRMAMDDARALHQVVERELHDDVHGGWREHGDGDWSRLAADDCRIQVPYPGRKSGNAVVHWIEALTELYSETGDDRVRRSLTEALDVAREFLFTTDPSRSCEYRMPDWAVDPRAENVVSYGHDAEFAWLMVRAEQALGVEPTWHQFRDYLDHTLRWGFDARRGGLYALGRHGEIADRMYKVWWAQCELVAALADAWLRWDDERDARALALTLAFVERYMTDRRDGVMIESVEANGHPRSRRKAGHWKAGYHEVRAAVKLAEAARSATDPNRALAS